MTTEQTEFDAAFAAMYPSDIRAELPAELEWSSPLPMATALRFLRPGSLFFFKHQPGKRPSNLHVACSGVYKCALGNTPGLTSMPRIIARDIEDDAPLGGLPYTVSFDWTSTVCVCANWSMDDYPSFVLK